MQHLMVPVGQFFFKWRNIAFPLIVLTIYLAFKPTTEIVSARAFIALVCIAIGVLTRMSVIGFFEVARDGDKKTAHADELFTRGMFGISRNTLYLGNLTTYFGIFLLHGAPVALLLGFGIFLFIYYSIIFSEEAYLRGKFGDSFDRYCEDVPRLLPKLTNWAKATNSMAFSWKRAVFGEFNVIGQSVLMVFLALWYKSYLLTGSITPPVAGILMLIAGVIFMLSIRTIKRR